MIQFPLTWAEDKATVGTDLSADPGAKTEWGGTMPPSVIRDWHNALNPGLATSGMNPTRRRGLGCVWLSWSRLRVRSQPFLSPAAAPLPIPS